MTDPLRGVLHFYSETGTEGGFWAFQDERFIGLEDDAQICSKCGLLREYAEGVTAGRPVQAVSAWRMDQEQPPRCPDGEHVWKRQFPNGRWSYEGLHTLEDGDHLTIFDRTEPERIVWEGVVSLGPFSVFEEDAFGMWIHNDQQGIDRETWARWFMEENPAILVPAR